MRLSVRTLLAVSFCECLAFGQSPGWEPVERAPLLVTGRIVSIVRDTSVPIPSQGPQPAIAAIEVSRLFHAVDGSPAAGSVIHMGYKTILPGQAGGGSGRFPSVFDVGAWYVIPLTPGETAAAPWRLVDTYVSVIPASAILPVGEPDAADAHAFVIRELANAAVNGSPAEARRAARFLFERTPTRVMDLMPLFERYTGGVPDRWAALARTLLAAMPPGRPSAEDLKSKPQTLDIDRLTQAVLLKLG